MGDFDRGAEARRNIIVSHGGKHGASQTFLRGAPIPPETAKHIPKGDGLIVPADLTGVPVEAPAPAVTTLAPPTPPAGRQTATGQPQTLPSATAQPGTPAATGQAGVTPPAKPPMPTNVRELFAMKKDELLALAADLNVPVDGEQTVPMLRETLKTALEF